MEDRQKVRRDRKDKHDLGEKDRTEQASKGWKGRRGGRVEGRKEQGWKRMIRGQSKGEFEGKIGRINRIKVRKRDGLRDGEEKQEAEWRAE